MTHFHAVMWIDHREARIFHFNREHAEGKVLHADRPDVHVHRKAGEIGPGKAPEQTEFFHAVAQAAGDAGEVLVAGPAQAKHEFARWAERHEPDVHKRIVGLETVDHPTDPQLVAYARRYFAAADRMRPQKG